MPPHLYAMDMSWPAILRDLGLRTADVLRRAQLPEDLFARRAASLDTADYFRFWEALEHAAGDARFPLRIYQVVRGESFSPPLFAALCSPDLRTALQRLSRYKPLIAPMRLDVVEERGAVTARIAWLDRTRPPPATLVAAELLFTVALARMGTRERIVPLRVVSEEPPRPAADYEAFLGVAVRKGRGHAVTYSEADAARPFLSSNDAMWSIFEPELRRRLAELDAGASTAERVRAALLEVLPGGNVSMDAVARRLALSKRTLQRRLEAEGASYQGVLRATREALSLHYLERTALPFAEIAFLVGFEEPNSFFRAFGEWTGQTPDAVRRGAPCQPNGALG